VVDNEINETGVGDCRRRAYIRLVGIGSLVSPLNAAIRGYSDKFAVKISDIDGSVQTDRGGGVAGTDVSEPL
jgi:hypothetical protein